MPQQPSNLTCPCKKLPWSVSSFTAAEYGDIHSLRKKGQLRNGRLRRDAAGCTPLHLAAQHNHVAATSLLLQMGYPVDGKEDGDNEEQDMGHESVQPMNTSTPLHRAAFAGATSTMRILIAHNCDLVSPDTSFGDLRTPLHKAAAGGRYLAVQLLLDALRDLSQNGAYHPGSTHCLAEALQTRDKSSRTPLQLAQHYYEIQDEERISVARWDAVAGGQADWGKCVAILAAAEKDALSSDKEDHHTKQRDPLKPLPDHLIQQGECLDCQVSTDGDQAGMCLTASWQAAFQAALGASVDLSISTAKTLPARLESQNKQAVHAEPLRNAIAREEATAGGGTVSEPSSTGVACASCGKLTISLYLVLGGKLVCKSCKRKHLRG